MHDDMIERASAAPGQGIRRKIILRDLFILELKLWTDGFKDILLAQVALGAAAVEMLIGPANRGKFFYPLLRLGERFDLWLNLYGAAKAAQGSRGGLFDGSEPGDSTLLGTLEELQQCSSGPATPDRQPIANGSPWQR